MKSLLIAGAVMAAASLSLAACDHSLRPPGDAGVCYQLVVLKNGAKRFNSVATDIPNLENCAARLEAMRLRFLSLGGSRTEITGAYQGRILFIQREGVFTAETLEGAAYPALVRSGDGRLVVPGAMPRAR